MKEKSIDEQMDAEQWGRFFRLWPLWVAMLAPAVILWYFNL